MTSKKDTMTGGLLPTYFKKIGLSLIIITLIGLVVIKLSGITLSPDQITITLNLIIAGLLIIAISKDKIEDEMTLSLRWKAMSWCFITIVVYVIITPLGKLLLGQATVILSGQQLVLFMLIGFLLMYTYLKKTS